MSVIRPYQPDDAAALAQIYFDAVHIGAAAKYNAAERAAWAPSKPTAREWQQHLGGLNTLVALQNNIPAGFLSWRNDGLIDLLYVAPNRRGYGIADALYHHALPHIKAQNPAHIFTHASHLAKSFFLRMGWQVEREQTIMRNGQKLTNFYMILSDN